MSVCLKPVAWDDDGTAEMWCEADTPCPYHDRNGLTNDQRRQWRIEWATEHRRMYGLKS